MTEVGVHEAKTHLSRLLRRVEAGEEIVVTRGGKQVARIVPVAARPKRRLGVARGQIQIGDDFDDPLPDELLELFYK